MPKMSALLYQEFICNKKAFLGIIPISLLCQLFPFLLFILSGENSDSIDDSIVTIIATLMYCIFLCITYFANVVIVLTPIMKHNEKRGWGRFVLSTPDTSKLQIRFYYEIVLGILIFTNFISNIFISLLSSVTNTALQLPTILNTILFFILLLFNAIDLPCYVTFTQQRGDKVHTLSFMLIVLILIVYVLFGDLSYISEHSDDLMEKLFSMLNSHTLSNGFLIFMAVLPPVSIIAYLFSYRLSCKYYRKGVLQYEK